MYFHPVIKNQIIINEIIKSITFFKVLMLIWSITDIKKKFGGGFLLDQGIYPISLTQAFLVKT